MKVMQKQLMEMEGIHVHVFNIKVILSHDSFVPAHTILEETIIPLNCNDICFDNKKSIVCV